MDDVEQMKTDVKTILADSNLVNGEFWIGGETSSQLDKKVVQLGDEKLIQPVMIIIIFAVLLVYLLVAFYFTSHFFFSTTINGADVSLKNEKQADQSIRRYAENYKLLLIERDGKSDEITGQEIG